MRWLVTGYGPFEQIIDNVSARVARESGYPFEILEVSYAAVDRFIDQLDPNSFDGWIAMGHDHRATRIRVESLGRNAIGPRPDVRGEGRLNAPINVGGPDTIAATAWIAPELKAESSDWVVTDDAGSYLCNYVLYQALEAFPDKYIGFLHLPPSEVMAVDRQVQVLQQLIAMTENAANIALAG